jgi:hypothetical protein
MRLGPDRALRPAPESGKSCRPATGIGAARAGPEAISESTPGTDRHGRGVRDLVPLLIVPSG